MLALLLLLAFFVGATRARGGFDDHKDGGHDCSPGSKTTDDYDYVIVGGGSGGVAAALWLSDALVRAGKPVSIAVIEKNDYFGGNVYDIDLVTPDAYDGSFGPKLRGGVGALRTTQLAMGLKRRLIAQANLTLYMTPFRNYMNMRGVRRLCRDPIEKAFEGDPTDPYSYGDFCNNRPPFVDPGADDNALFRGFGNLGPDAVSRGPSDAAWRYVLADVPYLTDEADIDAYGNWVFNYGGIQPFTNADCFNDSSCPYTRQNNRDWKTFLELELRKAGMPALNQNYSAFMADDNVGFTGDSDNGFSARSYLEYNLFEWNTNSFNGYLPGAESELIDWMVARAKERGVQFFSNERVKAVDRTSSSNVRYIIATTNRTVRARKFALLNLPPFYLFERMDQDEIVEYDGIDLGGSVIHALRAVRAVKVPQPTRTIKILAQWEPGKRAWWWDLLDNVNGNYSLRQYGTTACVSRIEFEDTPKHRCTNEVTAVYSDKLCRRKWQALAEDAERTGDYTTLKKAIVDEMKAAFPEVEHLITDPVLVKFKIFNSAWHIGKMSYDDIGSEDLAKTAAEPLGPSERVGLIGEAYFTRRSGWIEGAFRSAKRLVTRIAQLDGFATESTAVFDELFNNFFVDATGGVGDSSAFDSDGAFSAMGYMPPATTTPDSALTEPNERWGPYGDYSQVGYDQDSCRPSLYGIKL